MKFVAIAFLISVILIAGCASQTTNTNAAYPTFVIRSPAQGQVIQGSTIPVILDGVQNIILVTPNGLAAEGQGHFHLYLDNSNEILTPRLEYDYQNVAPGEHTVRIEMRRGDHLPFNPAVIKAVSFTVAGQMPSPSTIPPPNTTNSTVSVKEFNITAKQFSFEPNTITVNKGDTVRINARSTDVTHGLAIAQYDVDMQLAPGQTQTTTFTADTAGNFSFICSVFCGSGHGSMRGTLVVQ